MRFIKKERNIPYDILHFNEDNVDGSWVAVEEYTSLHKDGAKKLRDYLLKEQNSLCAYCQQKIEFRKSKIEHIVCQSHSKHYSLAYHNLVIVCNGNDAATRKETHCDVHRERVGNKYIIPFFYFDECITKDRDNLNKYIDVQTYSGKTNPTGLLVPSKRLKDDYLISQVQNLIDVLNLNSKNLVNARFKRFTEIDKAKANRTWETLFKFYISPEQVATPFLEFILLAIRKQF